MIAGVSYVDNERYYKVNGIDVPYDNAQILYELPTMADRREDLTYKFGLDTYKNERHKDFFEEKTNIRPNSRYKPIIQEHTCNIDRYKNSSIPNMSRLLNKVELEKHK